MRNVISKLLQYKSLAILCLVSVLILLSAGLSIYGYISKQKPTQKPEVKAERVENPEYKKQQEIIETAAEQINLPTNEKPIIATVENKDDLQNQEFFEEAQNGDKILMYPINKKAYLYRPSQKRVLVEAPLQYQDATASASISEPAPVSDTTRINPTEPPHGKILVNPR